MEIILFFIIESIDIVLLLQHKKKEKYFIDINIQGKSLGGR